MCFVCSTYSVICTKQYVLCILSRCASAGSGRMGSREEAITISTSITKRSQCKYDQVDNSASGSTSTCPCASINETESQYNASMQDPQEQVQVQVQVRVRVHVKVQVHVHVRLHVQLQLHVQVQLQVQVQTPPLCSSVAWG